MKVGLTLSGDLISEDGARFAAQIGATDVVVHLTDYARGADVSPYLTGGRVGPIGGDCTGVPLWSYERMADLVGMLRRHGLRPAALENFSPNFWHDVLLDGPEKRAQIEGLKRLVRDAGRAGIPAIGYNFRSPACGAGCGGRRRAAAPSPPFSTSTRSIPLSRSPTAWSGTCDTVKDARVHLPSACPMRSCGIGSLFFCESSFPSRKRPA